MRPITLFLIVAVATIISISRAEFVQNEGHTLKSPHMVGNTPSEGFTTIPAIFDLKFYKNGKFMRACKGFELSDTYMWMTAAECFDGDGKTSYDTVVLEDVMNGEFRKYSYKLDPELPKTERLLYVIHPNYTRATNENNIAMISPPDTSDPQKKPIYEGRQKLRLGSPKQKLEEGQTADIFLKWKNTTKELDRKESFGLHSIHTKVIKSSWCKLWYRSSPIKKQNACVSGWYWKGLDKADIGSPLVIRQVDNTMKVFGIATIVRPWTHWFGLPIEFLNLDEYKDWISRVKWEM